MWHARIRSKGRSTDRPAPAQVPSAPAHQSATRVHLENPDATRALSHAIFAHLVSQSPRRTGITIVCIGSDRSTGDALGPLVGSKLTETFEHPDVDVKGTLARPVHAANLSDELSALSRESRDRLVVAVDACLGRSENVGTVCVKPGPLKPGTGVNKSLPDVGSFHIVGVVNVGGFMEYFVLQNTRLNLVVRLAELIAAGIADGATRYFRRSHSSNVAVTLDK